MIFTELRFLGFFLLVFAVHWALRHNGWRKLWLLASSYFFYAAWDWRFLSLILLSTSVAFGTGLLMSRSVGVRSRKQWLVLSIATNLGVLGAFKYFDFFIESGRVVLAAVGLPASVHTLGIILPVGISFYTFQTLSYSIDVYRGRLPATRKALDLALYIGFFPQLVAGPIVRATDFLPHLTRRRSFAGVRVRACLVLFLVGFIKKAGISDTIAPGVDRYFADPAAYTALGAWIGVLFYAVQIYCDFSGYSDMAIACAGLLGYNLCTNFRFPYLASSVAEFWQRWHISLSSWLRDYLYIPLGGNRGSRLFIYRNLMLTMLLGGLWHGAAWRFVIWGGLHGAALVASREWSRWVRPTGAWAAALPVLGALATFYWVCVAWIFFRAPDLETAFTVVRSFVLLESPGAKSLGTPYLLLFGGLAALHWVGYRRWFSGLWERIPAGLFAPAYGVACAVALAFVRPHTMPFIYFQF